MRKSKPSASHQPHQRQHCRTMWVP